MYTPFTAFGVEVGDADPDAAAAEAVVDLSDDP